MTKKFYSTSELMKTFSVGRNTLRLYEEKGLLTGMKRTDSQYRQYSAEHLRDLQFILEAKKSGFSLVEIKSLLDLFKSNQKLTCGSVSQEVSEKVSEVEEQIKVLKQKKAFLMQFLDTCKSTSPNSKCDVITSGFNKKACCG